MDEWNEFIRRWLLFKEGSGMSDESAPSQLFPCTSKELRDNLLKFDPENPIRPFDELTEFMRRLAVIPIATGILKIELIQMRQMRDEAFRSFAARVNGKDDACTFFADCFCGLKVNCTDHMFREFFLNEISNIDIRREIWEIFSLWQSTI